MQLPFPSHLLFSDFVFVVLLALVCADSQPQSQSEPLQDKFAGMSAVQVPRGVFHYSMRESGLGSNFRVPDQEMTAPLQVGGRFRTKDSTVDGFYLPMPMGMDPINFQLMRANERTRELQTSEGDVTAEEAYAAMKRLCAAEASAACETAMQTYYRLRVDRADEGRAPVYERLLKLSDIVSRARMWNDESNDVGVLFSAPGIQPIGWRTNLANLDHKNLRIE